MLHLEKIVFVMLYDGGWRGDFSCSGIHFDANKCGVGEPKDLFIPHSSFSSLIGTTIIYLIDAMIPLYHPLATGCMMQPIVARASNLHT